MEKIFYLGMMIAAGLLFGLQSPINAQLSRSVGVLEGSFLSFLGGTLVLGIAVLLFGKGHVGGVFGVPAWQLVGGLLGATVCRFPLYLYYNIKSSRCQPTRRYAVFCLPAKVFILKRSRTVA